MNGRDDEWIIAIMILLGVWMFEILILCAIGIDRTSAM